MLTNRRLPVFLVIIILTSFFSQTNSAGAIDIFGFDLGTDLRARSHLSNWFTSDDDDNEEYTGQAIDYESDLVASWTIEDSLTLNKNKFFGGRIQRPFHDTPEHNIILEKTENASNAFEDYLIYLDLFPLGLNSQNSLIRFISAFRVDYRRNFFRGKGTAVEQAVFADRNGKMTFLDLHDSFEYQADFKDWYFSFLKIEIRNRRCFRFGIYKSLLKKPHESILTATTPDNETGDLIVDTKLSGYGGFWLINNDSFYFLLRMGSVKFEPLGNVDEYMLYKSKGSFGMLMDLCWSPRINLSRVVGGGEINRIYLSPSMGFLFRADYLDSDTTNLAIIDSELSMDIILDFGIRFQWLFG